MQPRAKGSRAVRETTSVVFSHQVCGGLSWWPQEVDPLTEGCRVGGWQSRPRMWRMGVEGQGALGLPPGARRWDFLMV